MALRSWHFENGNIFLSPINLPRYIVVVFDRGEFVIVYKHCWNSGWSDIGKA